MQYPFPKRVSLETARQFFETVLPGDIPDGLTIPLWMKEGKRTIRVASIAQILEELGSKKNHDGKELLETNIYFGQLQRPTIRGRGTDADTAGVFLFGKDIDIAGPGHAAENLPQSFEEALDLLFAAIPLRPTVVWKTGGGIQAAWVLKRPFLTVEDEDLRYAMNLAERFQAAFDTLFKAMGVHIDATPDIGRVLRIPGTYNWKTGEPRFVELLEVNDCYYTIEQLDEMLPELASGKVTFRGEARLGLTADQAAEMLSFIPKQLPYEDWLKVLMALNTEFGDEGIELAEAWSPGYEGEIANKFSSFKARESAVVTARTLVYMAEKNGYVRHVDPVLEDGISAHRVLNTRYIGDLNIRKRVTVVKSDRGTGKTEALANAVKDSASFQNHGHRRALLRNLSGRLNTDFYMDVDEPAKSSRLSICLNSLPRLITDGRVKPVETISIDEFEQVLAHLTAGDFAGNRYAVMQILSFLLKKAKKIIVLDADMSWVGYEAIKMMSAADEDDIDVIYNKYHPGRNTAVEYRTAAELTAKMVADINAGKNVFVASNSRHRCLNLQRMLIKKFPELRVLTLTHDNSQDPEVQEIIANVNEKITDYQVLITSPALGTGVSIDVEHFDACYAIGEHGVTTAMDFCQQMARVRTLRDRLIHFYVAPAYGDAACTDVAKLKEICITNAIDHGLAFNINDDGEVTVLDEQYLQIWASVHARQNASKNHFRQHVRQILRGEGHELARALDIDASGIVEEYNEAREEVADEWRKMVVAAEPLDSMEFTYYSGMTWVPPETRAAITKYIIQTTYNMDVDEPLVDRHEGGLLGEFTAYSDVVDEDGEAALRADSADVTYGKMMIIRNDGKVEYDEHKVARKPMPHRQYRAMQRKLRREILERSGLGIDLSGRITNDGLLEDYSWRKWLDENKDKIGRMLGVHVPKNPGVAFVGRITAQLGIPLTVERRKVKRKHIREYFAHPEAHDFMKCLIKARDKAFEERFDPGKFALEWMVTKEGIVLLERAIG